MKEETILSIGNGILKEFAKVRKLYSPEYEKEYEAKITPKVEKLRELMSEMDNFGYYLKWAWMRPIHDIYIDERIEEFNKYFSKVGCPSSDKEFHSKSRIE